MSHLQLPVVITPTRAELGARCHRRHFLSDNLGKARYFSASLEFGSVCHSGAGAHWLQKDWREALQVEWAKRFELNSRASQEKVSLALAEGMLGYYVEHSQLAGPFTDQGDWKLVDVEQRFEVPLRDFKLSFQCDRMAYNEAEDWLVIVDLKTAARLDYRWERQFETSLQMKLYKGAAKTVFQASRVDVVVEGLLKDIPSNIRYYVCPDWSDLMLAEAAHNAHTIAAMDAEVIVAGSDVIHNIMTPGEKKLILNQDKVEQLAVTATPVNYMDCFSYGIECPFRRICVADVPERVSILRGEYFDKLDDEDY